MDRICKFPIVRSILKLCTVQYSVLTHAIYYNNVTSDCTKLSFIGNNVIHISDQWSKCNGAGARVKTVTVTYLDGDAAHLPCDIAGGEVYTVLWYKGNHGQPFYTWVIVELWPWSHAGFYQYNTDPSAAFNASVVLTLFPKLGRLQSKMKIMSYFLDCCVSFM